MNSKILYFATGNAAKVKEVRAILRDLPFTIVRIDEKGKEIQSDFLEEIAKVSACRASRARELPLFVEDSGLFINCLRGFPGPYTSYALRTIGLSGVLTLMQGITEREAFFRSVVSFCRPNERPIGFIGEVSGFITIATRGDKGFGFDPIFEPKGGCGRTFAEMTVQEKNVLSHRARAVHAFAEWYLGSGFV